MGADVLWARHGENVANLSRTLSYRVFDGELTEVGRGQARELGERVAGGGGGRIGLVVCSPLRRARQTAEIVGQRLGLPVAMELDELREVNVGDLDGRSDAQAWEIYTTVLAAWRAGDTQARFPGGENRDELCARLLRALTAVARGAEAGRSRVPARTGVGEGRSLVVAHGANLRAALPCLTGEPDPGADLPTGGVAALHVDLGGPGGPGGPGGSPDQGGPGGSSDPGGPGGLAVVRLLSWAGAAPG